MKIGFLPQIDRKFLALVLAILAIAPLFLQSDYVLHILILTLMYATLSQGWNLIGGYGGQLSLGHAAFFGIGAYSSAIFYGSYSMSMSIPSLGLSPWLSLILGGLSAALVALLIGGICFRLKGPYFLISTLALAEVLQIIFLNARDYTNGAIGILLNSPPNVHITDSIFIDFSTKTPYYVIGLILAAVATSAAYYLSTSRFGYYLMALREDSDAAEGLGVNTFKLKMYALLISAFFTGVAGCFYVYYMRFIDPFLVFGIAVSVQAVILTYFGGSGTVFGPVLGAIILVPSLELLRLIFDIGGPLVYGTLLIVIVLLMPGGMLRKIRR